MPDPTFTPSCDSGYDRWLYHSKSNSLISHTPIHSQHLHVFFPYEAPVPPAKDHPSHGGHQVRRLVPPPEDAKASVGESRSAQRAAVGLSFGQAGIDVSGGNLRWFWR